jgi:hypothetical protein
VVLGVVRWELFVEKGSAEVERALAIVSPPGMEACLAEVIGDEEIHTATFVEKVTAMAPKYQMEIVGPPRRWLSASVESLQRPTVA